MNWFLSRMTDEFFDASNRGMIMPNDFLQKIVAYKRELLEKKKPSLKALGVNTGKASLTRYRLFRNAISHPGQIRLIAEIKKASPSKGLIREDFDVQVIAKIYAKHGAAAISVLTEERYFLGKPEYIRKVANEVKLPVLRKDFIIDELQIAESFNLGASAILLIAAILDDAQLKLFISRAASLDIDCLVEVHDEAELDRSLAAGAEIIGINNRDLRSFEVDLGVSERLIPRIPKDRVIVVESGIQSCDEVKSFRAAGANAVLIGETFMRSKDIGQKIDEMMSRIS